MGPESSESGFEELIRLSRQTRDVEHQMTQKEKQLAERKQLVQGLREINFKVALEQLKSLATPQIVKDVSSIQNQRDTAKLRSLISNLAAELEKSMDDLSATQPALAEPARSAKTLAILVELLFSVG